MPRRARKKSESGIYHVVIRGTNRTSVFVDDEDIEKMKEILKACIEKSGCRVLAYCLMSNHFHLLIKVENEELGSTIKRIACSYVYWFNVKYSRSGHLFEDRYKSEAVETDEMLKAVLRYIHHYPVSVGVCQTMESYEHSSYGDYKQGKSQISDIDYVFSVIGKRGFEECHKTESEYPGLEAYNTVFRVTDSDARKIIAELTGRDDFSDIRSMDAQPKKELLSALREKGLSIRQINRLTGVGKGIIERASANVS